MGHEYMGSGGFGTDTGPVAGPVAVSPVAGPWRVRNNDDNVENNDIDDDNDHGKNINDNS